MKLTKITLKEFFESDESLYIHCDTEEKANILCKKFDKLDKRWVGGKSYLHFNHWDRFKQNTCYSNKRIYTHLPSLEHLNCLHKVYEFEDIIF